jgi:hypothetical protein
VIEGDFQAPNWLDLQRLHHNRPMRLRPHPESKPPSHQTHVAKGAAMLSDAIEDKLENVIDRVPGGSQVRPLIESTVQVALATALEAIMQKRWRQASR